MKKKITLILSLGMLLNSILFNAMTSYAATDDSTILEQQLDMPIISITSSGSISSKDTYTDATVSVYDENGTSELSDEAISIRLRGNSTLNTSKKSYKMKFEAKQNLLNIGDGAGKTWNLVANAFDTSMIRNYTAYHMGDMLDGMVYTPNCQSVEVYLNGTYQGVYSLCEAVNINKNRVNITENADGVEDTGYLIEMSRYAEENYFDVDLERYEIKNDLSEDATIKAQQEKYISDYITESYNALKTGTEKDVSELIDLDSLVDLYIASEVVKNVDAGWDSFYMYKDVDGKLCFGPMWDFDLALGNFADTKSFDDWKGLNVYDCANISSNSNPWFVYAVQQDWFRELVINRWNEKVNELSTLDDIALDEANENIKGYEHNCTKWSTLGNKQFSEPESIYKLSTYTEHAEYLADWIESRINWLDEYFNSDNFDHGILIGENDNVISDEGVNIAEYTTNFMQYASDYTTDDTPSITVNFGSNSWWNMYQFCMTGFIMEKDVEYEVSFDYSATSNMNVSWKIQQNYSPYTAYISKSVSATSEVQHYTETFTGTKLDTNCTFVVEGNGTSGASVTVSNITLKKVSIESDESVQGDINEDGSVDLADLILLEKWILKKDSKLSCTIDNSDLSKDNKINAIDLSILKNNLLNK